MDVTLDVIFACKCFSDVILHVISDMHGERARCARRKFHMNFTYMASITSRFCKALGAVRTRSALVLGRMKPCELVGAKARVLVLVPGRYTWQCNVNRPKCDEPYSNVGRRGRPWGGRRGGNPLAGCGQLVAPSKWIT